MRPVFENFSEFVKNHKIILEDEENPSLASNKKSSSISSNGDSIKETPAIKKGIKKIKDQILSLFKKKEESKYAKGDSEKNYPEINPKKFYFDKDLNKFIIKYTTPEDKGKYKKWEIPQEDLDQMASDSDIDKLIGSIEDNKKFLDIGKEKLKDVSSDLDKEATDSLINPLIDFVQETIKKKPGSSSILGKNIINLKANAHLQAILKELGLLKSKAGPGKDGITCYFNGETEKALEKLSGMKSISVLDPDGIEILKDSILDDGRSYNKGFREKIIKSRDQALKKKKIELKPYIDTGMFLDYYNQQWSETHWRNMKLNLTGDILEDMYIFNSVKEGGLADDPKDTGPASTPCPYGFDVSTGILTYGGKEYKLNPSKEVKNSKSVINGGTWSDRWHTSRGIVWPTWKATANLMGITDELEIAKKYFEMSNEDAKRVYEKSFYEPYIVKSGKKTISPLVNHCMGTAAWASIGHLNKTYEKTLSTLKSYGYPSIDDAIEKIGEKIVTEIMLIEQMNIYKSYKNFKDFGTAWTNGMLNFHRYFVPMYADLPIKNEFPAQYKNREELGVNGYANLEDLA